MRRCVRVVRASVRILSIPIMQRPTITKSSAIYPIEQYAHNAGARVFDYICMFGVQPIVPPSVNAVAGRGESRKSSDAIGNELCGYLPYVVFVFIWAYYTRARPRTHTDARAMSTNTYNVHSVRCL